MLEPDPVRLLVPVQRAQSVEMQHVQQHRLRHAVRELRVDHPGQRQVLGDRLVGQQGLHAGPGALDEPKLRQTRQGARCGVCDHDDLRLLIALRRDSIRGQRGPQRGQPALDEGRVQA
jgi:hypothetical protein